MATLVVVDSKPLLTHDIVLLGHKSQHLLSTPVVEIRRTNSTLQVDSPHPPTRSTFKQVVEEPQSEVPVKELSCCFVCVMVFNFLDILMQ